MNSQFLIFWTLISILSNSSHLLTALWHKLPNQKVSAWLWLKSIKKGVRVLHMLLWTQTGPQIFFFSFSPTLMLLPFILFIPHWLTCFTSCAVFSTAFTELINGAEGWALLNWDNSFSLSLAHVDNYIQKIRTSCKKRQGVGEKQKDKWTSVINHVVDVNARMQELPGTAFLFSN